LFQNIGHMDSWVYFGEFQHFPDSRVYGPLTGRSE
jgi:hypothetical protein